MAKTIDDLIVEISDLVKTLNKQNSNSGGRSGHNSFDLTGDAFQSFAGEIHSLTETAKQLSKAQSDFATEIAKTGNSKWHEYRLEMVENMKNSQAMMNEFQKEFGHSGRQLEKDIKERLDAVAKLKSEEASIQEKIVAKKEILAKTEQKLINDELEIKLAELEARRNHKEELEKISNETKEIAEKLAEHNQILSQKRKEKENEENRVVADDEELQKRILKSEDDEKLLIKKQKNIDQTHREGQNIKTKLEQKGFTDDGKKKANAELSSIIGDWKKYIKTTDKGRIVADGTKIAAQGAAKGFAGMTSGAMNINSITSGLSSGFSKLGPWGMVASAVVKVLKESFDMFSKVDKAASNYARSVGGGRYAQVKMRESVASLTKEMSKWGKTAYDVEDILNRMEDASEALGRNLEGLSTNDLRSLKDLKNFGIDDQTISQFDTFGISVHNVSKQIGDLYGESGKRGLNAKATIKAFTSNLKMAQNYTFARGQKALMDMAMKSAQLKFNLRDAEQFANKVSTLEGAMTAGAQLSVLGGNFAMQGNPLAMMYNALNDVEGLQNQMLAMTKGMARWDSKKGQLDISAFDRERLKAMSQATGIDYSELTSQAFNQARVDRVSAQLGGGFKREEEEYIKNLASLDEHGNAYIQVGDKEYSMDDIRRNKDGVRNQLKAESEAKDIKEGADMGDIWGETRDIKSIMDDYVKFFKGRFLSLLMRIGGLKDHEVVAQRLGLDLEEDKEQVKELKNAMLGKKIARYATGITTGAGAGAGIGTAAGMGIGSIPGAAVGAFFGGIVGGVGAAAYDSKDDTEFIMNYAKEHKLGMYGEQKKASGGFVSGNGGPTEDSIPARLSNGEFVVNAEATTRHRPLLERINRGIRNGSNLMRSESIMGLGSGELRRGGGNQKIDVSPIKIEFGTLELKIGDLSRVLDSNEVASRLLNNSAFVDNIVKEIGIRANFGYRKDDSSNKFLDSPFVRSF